MSLSLNEVRINKSMRFAESFEVIVGFIFISSWLPLPCQFNQVGKYLDWSNMLDVFLLIPIKATRAEVTTVITI